MQARLFLALLVTLTVLLHGSLSKVFERCELVRELLKKKHRIPPEDVATWVCIAQHESQYNSSAVGHLNADGSGDHGLFQISDLYWCSPPGVGWACGVSCSQLEDDDIKDDIVCARRIYRATKRRTGDGFTAWAVYGQHCRVDVSEYTTGCEGGAPTTSSTTSTTTPTTGAESWSTSTTTEVASEASPEYPTSGEGSSTTEETFVDEYSSTSEDSELASNSEELSSERKFPKVKAVKSIYSNSKPMSMAKDIFPHGRSSALAPRMNQLKSRSRETSSSFQVQRPTSAGKNLDLANAWLQIHYSPRFLDETS